MSIEFIGMACALGLSAMGSAFGAGFAAQASVGAWKKCYANGKPAPFIMVAFSGAPLTQTIYGFLLMNFIRSAVASGADPALAMFTGIFAGLAIGLSAFFQGKVAAASIDDYLGFHTDISANLEVPPAPFRLKNAYGRVELAEREAGWRKNDFELMELGMTTQEMDQECSRCLRCDHYGHAGFKGGRVTKW